jgi:hypothetical protein
MLLQLESDGVLECWSLGVLGGSPVQIGTPCVRIDSGMIFCSVNVIGANRFRPVWANPLEDPNKTTNVFPILQYSITTILPWVWLGSPLNGKT